MPRQQRPVERSRQRFQTLLPTCNYKARRSRKSDQLSHPEASFRQTEVISYLFHQLPQWAGTDLCHLMFKPLCRHHILDENRCKHSQQDTSKPKPTAALKTAHTVIKWGARLGYKVKSEVAQSCPTLCNPVDYSLPGSSVHGIYKAGSNYTNQ